MRSAFLYFVNDPSAEIERWLDSKVDRANRSVARCVLEFPVGALYVDASRETFGMLKDELGDDWDALVDALGAAPTHAIQIDVSGRFDGRAELLSLCFDILRRWPGVAGDDEASEWWSLEELRADAPKNGRRCFRPAPKTT